MANKPIAMNKLKTLIRPPVAASYDIIVKKTNTDTTQDRLTHHAHRIEFAGESLRNSN
jgi:hypothetical protein